MTISLVVDWLSVTFDERIAFWPFFDHDSAETSTPRYGYTNSWKDDLGVIGYAGGANKSVHMVYSGDALNKLRDAGHSLKEMITVIGLLDGKVTRLDIAADWKDPGITVATLHDLVDLGSAGLKVKSWSYLESEKQGQTLYLGSRTSERMLRIYNKRAQLARNNIEVDQDWIRVEVELKGDQAHNAFNACRDNAPGAVLAAHIEKTVIFPDCDPWSRLIFNLPLPIPVVPSVRGRSNTDDWLFNVVAPIVKKRMKDPDFEALWLLMLTD